MLDRTVRAALDDARHRRDPRRQSRPRGARGGRRARREDPAPAQPGPQPRPRARRVTMRLPAAPTRSSSYRSTCRSISLGGPRGARRAAFCRPRPAARRPGPGSPWPRHERPRPRPADGDRVRVRRRQPGGPCGMRRRRRGALRRARRTALGRHRHARRPPARRVSRHRDGRCPLTTGRVEVVALDGIPEVAPGDDLAAFIGDALERRPDLLPLRTDDVLVVTQKIVSKAEGAIVDLTTVEPRPEAIEFAAKWDRDPRQVEVVLREARRVVRMANGVLITETPHGFVCANGGVDASNVGPGSGQIVTLLPAIRTRLRRGSERRSQAGSVSTSPSSSAIRSEDPGAGGSSTSRSVCQACCRSTTSAASPTTTAG